MPLPRPSKIASDCQQIRDLTRELEREYRPAHEYVHSPGQANLTDVKRQSDPSDPTGQAVAVHEHNRKRMGRAVRKVENALSLLASAADDLERVFRTKGEPLSSGRYPRTVTPDELARLKERKEKREREGLG